MATQQLRPQATRLRPDERRAALLDAAKQLFIERGPDFTPADLAGAAGVSEGTIFRYFPDKAALLSAVKDAALDLEALAARSLPYEVIASVAAVLPGRPLGDIQSILVAATPSNEADLVAYSDRLLELEGAVTRAVRP